jgi:hypothetical protein
VRTALVIAATVAIVLAGCGSPEATRLRAGGPGADVGNRGPIELHAGADPYYRTPTALRAPRSTTLAASPSTR